MDGFTRMDPWSNRILTWVHPLMPVLGNTAISYSGSLGSGGIVGLTAVGPLCDWWTASSGFLQQQPGLLSRVWYLPVPLHCDQHEPNQLQPVLGGHSAAGWLAAGHWLPEAAVKLSTPARSYPCSPQARGSTQRSQPWPLSPCAPLPVPLLLCPSTLSG